MNPKQLLKLTTILLIAVLSLVVLADDEHSPTFIASDAYPDVMNVGSPGLFTAQYQVRPDTSVTLYVCRASSCLNCGTLPDKSGCFCYNETPSINGQTQCLYTPRSTDTETSYYIKLINVTGGGNHQTDGRLGTDSANFRINKRPVATSVSINYNTSTPVNHSLLTCTYTYTDPDSDPENITGARFIWSKQHNGTGGFLLISGQTAQTLAAMHFQKFDIVMCTVNVTDSYQLSSYPGTNSTTIQIQNSAPRIIGTPTLLNNSPDSFINWSATFLDDDLDRIIVTNVRWYRNSVLMPVYDGMNLTPDFTTVGETWYAELHYEDSWGLSGIVTPTTPVTIQTGGPRIITINTSIMRENATLPGHDVTFTLNWSHDDYGTAEISIFICNVTGANAAGCPFGSRTYCTVSGDTLSPSSCAYTLRQTDPDTLTYYAIACDDSFICSMEMTGTFHKFTDTTLPNITASVSGRNMSASTSFTLLFNVSDNFNVSAKDIYLNVSNRTDETYHVLFNSTVMNHSWSLGENLSCSGNITHLQCSALINQTDGRYNITFFVNDSAGNIYLRTFGIIIDSIVPDVSSLGNGYVDSGGTFIISDFAPTKHIFANWTNITGTISGISHYEYAVGRGENYLDHDWDSVRNWTEAGLATHINFSAALFPGYSYFFHVRAVNNAGAYSNVTSSSGIIYEDNIPPVCMIVYDYGPHSSNWTNSANTLLAWWNFSRGETEIVEYEIAIGNATPPIQGNPPVAGFENVLTRRSTALTTFSSSSLTLHENQTYYFSVRAKNQYNVWSAWCYSDGVTVDLHMPRGGSISYPTSFVAYTNITIYAVPGVDDMSGIDYNNDVRLLVAKAPISPIDYTCPAFSAFTPASQGPPYNPMGTLFNTTPGYCYKFRLAVTDRAGNEKIYYSMQDAQDDYTVVSDITPPEPFEVFDTGHKTYVGTELEANWTHSSDPETGVSHYSYSIWKKSKVNGSMLLEYPWVNVSASTNHVIRTGLHLEDETQYFFYVKAVNRVGLETVPMTSNGIIYQDLSPPGPITLLGIENNTYLSGFYIDLNDNGNTTVLLHSTDFDLARCIYSETDTGYYERQDSTNICPVTAIGDDRFITCNISDATEGRKGYYVYCRDESGNNQFNAQHPDIPLAVNWVNDWNPPVLTINTPQNNQIVGGVVSIDLTVHDAGIGDISEVMIQIINLSGEVVENTSLSSPYNYLWETLNGTYNGTYALWVTATDALGMTSYASVNFTIDNGRPWIQIYAPEYINETFDFTILAQLFTNVSYHIYDLSESVMQYGSSNSTTMRNYYLWSNPVDLSNTTLWPESMYRIHGLVFDNASQNTSFDAFFVIDRTAPLIDDVSDTSGLSLYTGDWISLNATVTDQHPLEYVIIMTNVSGQWVSYSWTNSSQMNNLTKQGDTFSLDLRIPAQRNNMMHHWIVTSQDESGNYNQSNMMNFTVINSWPTYLGSDNRIDFGEDQIHTETLPYSDIDLDPLTLTATNGTNVFVISINHTSKTITLDSTPDWFGEDSITINATDPYGGWNFTVFNVTVYNVNDAPTFNTSRPVPNITFSMNGYDDSINISYHFYDIDNEILSWGYQAREIPDLIEISVNGDFLNISATGFYYGTFRLNLTASDGMYITRSNEFLVNVTRIPDLIIGNASDISTNIPNLRIVVNGTENFTSLMPGRYSIVLINDTSRNISNFHVTFEYDLHNESQIDLRFLSLYKQDEPTSGLLFSGIDAPGKTMLLHPDNFSIQSVCVKDNNTAGISFLDVTTLCNATDEQLVLCDGETYRQYTCDIYTDQNGTSFVIQGLNHSVVVQQDGCTDRDGDGAGTGGLCTGVDPDDNDPAVHTGSLCVHDPCYTGSTYNSLGICSGGTYTCGGGSGGGIYSSGGGYAPLPEDTAGCKERWVCTSYSNCTQQGWQTRSCYDEHSCGTTTDIPITRRLCEYHPLIVEKPSCQDGIQNQGEAGIDCGGPCAPCPTCNDGIQNCHRMPDGSTSCEEGIDCGGPCSICPEIEQPAPIVIIKEVFTKWIIPALILFLIAAVVAAFYYKRSSALEEKDIEDFWVKEEAGHILYYRKFKQKVFDKLIQLRIYIRKQLLAGKDKEQIKRDLINMGWTETIVEESFLLNKLVSLELYVRDQLYKGVTKEKIVDDLIIAGWEQSSIQAIFMLNTLVQVELYIRKKIGQGKTPDYIKKELLHTGWSDKTVEELFELNILLDLELYLHKQLSLGASEIDVKRKLVDLGWQEDVVDEAILFCKLTR